MRARVASAVPPIEGLANNEDSEQQRPQLTRYHPQVHETVYLLAETNRRATDSLAGFALWIGITL